MSKPTSTNYFVDMSVARMLKQQQQIELLLYRSKNS